MFLEPLKRVYVGNEYGTEWMLDGDYKTPSVFIDNETHVAHAAGEFHSSGLRVQQTFRCSRQSAGTSVIDPLLVDSQPGALRPAVVAFAPSELRTGLGRPAPPCAIISEVSPMSVGLTCQPPRPHRPLLDGVRKSRGGHDPRTRRTIFFFRCDASRPSIYKLPPLDN